MQSVGRVFIVMFLLLMPVTASAQAYGSYDAPQLDQLVAPIALYPDSVLGEILVAATYPAQVDEAAEWLEDPNNASLRGNDLTYALQYQPWDDSIKALVSVPDALFTLDNYPDWMEQLGSAFVSQQSGIMDAVQRARWQAYRAGRLQSNNMQYVQLQGGYIVVESVQPVQTIWVLPFWDWRHHRINSREDIRFHPEERHDSDGHFDARDQHSVEPQELPARHDQWDNRGEDHHDYGQHPVAAPVSQPQAQPQHQEQPRQEALPVQQAPRVEPQQYQHPQVEAKPAPMPQPQQFHPAEPPHAAPAPAQVPHEDRGQQQGQPGQQQPNGPAPLGYR